MNELNIIFSLEDSNGNAICPSEILGYHYTCEDGCGEYSLAPGVISHLEIVYNTYANCDTLEAGNTYYYKL